MRSARLPATISPWYFGDAATNTAAPRGLFPIVQGQVESLRDRALIVASDTEMALRTPAWELRNFENVLHVGWVGDFRRRNPPGLFRGLLRNSTPSVHPFTGSGGEMSFRTMGYDWDKAGRSQFRALLDHPLHAVEFEDGECESDICDRGGRNLFAQDELDAIAVDARDGSAPHHSAMNRGDGTR